MHIQWALMRLFNFYFYFITFDILDKRITQFVCEI